MAGRLTLAVPGDINTLTGGYLYDKRVLAELARQGWDVDVVSLDARFPVVQDVVKHAAAEQLAAVACDRDLVIDGLALGALGDHASEIGRPFMALVHHPLALESGIDPCLSIALHHSEKIALTYAQGVLVTSPTTRQTLLEQYAVHGDRITVIEPGVDKPMTAPERRPDNTPLRLLSVGAIVPRKGFDVLMRALSTLTALDWTLTVVGDDTRAPSTTQAVKDLIAEHGLGARVRLLGALPTEQLAVCYQMADAFVLASLYEGYGMAYAEALAWGLPVVGTNGGAAVQTLDTPAARVVAVNDDTALAKVLRALMTDQTLRTQMLAAARLHALRLSDWPSVGHRFAQAVTRMRTA